MEKVREELLEKLIAQMFSVAKQMHHSMQTQGTLLSPPHARLLFTIASGNENGISARDLAESIHVTPGAITQFADTLIEKGLIRRDEDPHDRRIIRMKLTESGKSQYQQLRREFLASAAETLDVLSNAEIKQFIELLAKISSHPKTKEFRQ
jgi:DNA-binding MarR family transcriptional regulator